MNISYFEKLLCLKAYIELIILYVSCFKLVYMNRQPKAATEELNNRKKETLDKRNGRTKKMKEIRERTQDDE